MGQAQSFLGGKEIHEFISGLVRAWEERTRARRRAYVRKIYFSEKDFRSRGKSVRKKVDGIHRVLLPRLVPVASDSPSHVADDTETPG